MDNAGYAIVYVEILVLCIVYSLVILLRMSPDLATKREIRVFQALMRIFILMLTLDGFAQLQYVDIIDPPMLIVALSYSFYQFGLTVLSVLWFLFVEFQIHENRPLPRLFYLLSCFPLLPIGILAFGSVKYDWFFHFDENNHFARGPLFPLMNVVAYLYFLVTTVHAFIIFSRTSSRRRKRRMLLLSAFIISPVIGATLQLTVGIHPFVSPSICISFVFIFISIQSDQINTDALTGLNNRKSMNHYIDEIRTRASEQTPYYFYLIDADSFKSINDSKGHAEGDNALCYIADALRDACDGYHGFIARYGGDEFVAVIDGAYLRDPEDFVQSFDESLLMLCTERTLSYPLSASVGYTRLASQKTNTASLVSAADRMLYQRKREKHTQSTPPVK